MRRELFKIVLTTALVVATANVANAQWAFNGSHIYNTNSGNVGIGITNPDAKLTIAGTEIFRFFPNATVRLLDFDYNMLYGSDPSRNGASMRFDLRPGQPAFAWSYRQAGAPLPATTEYVKMVIDQNGRVGIGTVTPSYLLDVAGDVRITGTLNTGNLAAKYQDVAEWVPTRTELQPATVVVLDREEPNHVLPSALPYDSAVAGVVSAEPGVVLGIAGADKAKIATTGRVKVRVDATAAPIRIGDLLVTSGKEGTAMRSIPVDVGGVQMHRPGTVIGKALEPLDSGVGEILVLLTLQ